MCVCVFMLGDTRSVTEASLHHSCPGWLNVGLDIFFQTGAPLRETIPIMERIRKAVPMMKRIWEHSSMSLESRDQILQRTLWFEEDVKRELDEGRATLDSQILPDWCAVEELVI